MGAKRIPDVPVLIRILGWNPEKQWGGHYSRDNLVDLLRKATPLSNLEAKRAVKILLAGPPAEVLLQDGRSYASFLHMLQSFGAEVEAIPQAASESDIQEANRIS